MGKPVDIKNTVNVSMSGDSNASAATAINTRLASVETAIIARLPIDDDYPAVPTLDISHEQIHRGLHWNTSAYQAGSASVNTLIVAPANTGIGHYHFVAEIVCTGPANVTWSKTPNFDPTGGSVLFAYNNNEDRAASNLSTLTHTLGGAYTSSGTILATFLIGSNNTKSVIGGSEGHKHEWELGYGTTHLIRVNPAASCETVIRTYFYRKS